MILARQGFARALRLDSNGDLQIVGQFNARSNESVIAAAAVVGGSTPKDQRIVLIEPANDRLQILKRRRDGVWRVSEDLEIPPINLVEARSVDLDASGSDDLVLFGSDRFVWLPSGGRDPVLRPESSWECDLEGVTYNLLGVGDLDNDGVNEIVAVDTRDTHVLEVLHPGTTGEWQSLLHFTVFEADPHYEGHRGGVHQPREIVIADLTDDGLDDLVLVVHDRLLLYPQIPSQH
jgi:hypothetical protein